MFPAFCAAMHEIQLATCARMSTYLRRASAGWMEGHDYSQVKFWVFDVYDENEPNSKPDVDVLAALMPLTFSWLNVHDGPKFDLFNEAITGPIFSGTWGFLAREPGSVSSTVMSTATTTASATITTPEATTPEATTSETGSGLGEFWSGDSSGSSLYSGSFDPSGCAFWSGGGASGSYCYYYYGSGSGNYGSGSGNYGSGSGFGYYYSGTDDSESTEPPISAGGPATTRPEHTRNSAATSTMTSTPTTTTTATTTATTTTYVPTTATTTAQGADIVLLLDKSSSVGNKSTVVKDFVNTFFDKALSGITEIINDRCMDFDDVEPCFNVSTITFHVAVVSFATDATIEGVYRWTTEMTKDDVIVMDAAAAGYGATNLDIALQVVQSNLIYGTKEGFRRPTVPLHLVLVTDGQLDDYATGGSSSTPSPRPQSP